MRELTKAELREQGRIPEMPKAPFTRAYIQKIERDGGRSVAYRALIIHRAGGVQAERTFERDLDTAVAWAASFVPRDRISFDAEEINDPAPAAAGEPSDYEVLKRYGFTPAKAQEIALDAKRGDAHACIVLTIARAAE